MRLVIHILILFFALALTSVHALTDSELQQVEFLQYPGRELPLNLVFTDADGTALKLADCFRGSPVVLVPGYFRCRMLCEGVSDGLILALQGSRKEMGKDFRVVFVSIDPNEPLVEAQAKKRTFLKRYARPGTEGGCNFLTGNPDAIKTLAECIGYRFLYDPASGEFAHPAGFVVVRPDGKLFRYFLGVSFSASELDKAIADAAKLDNPPSAVERLALLCFHYNPVRSRYGTLVIYSVRVLALATIAGLIYLVIRSGRSKRSNAPKPPEQKN